MMENSKTQIFQFVKGKMITSKQITILSEEYLTVSKNMQGVPIEVYVNPTNQDFLDLSKAASKEKRSLDAVRFIADDRSKKVYMVDAYLVNHDGFRKILGLSADYKNTFQLFDGIAGITNNRVTEVAWDKYSIFVKNASGYQGHGDFVTCRWFDNTLKINWSWVDKYFPGFSSRVLKYKLEYESYKNR